MSLALLTLSLLCARPACAQDSGHYWKITFSTTGQTTFDIPHVPADGTTTPGVKVWASDGNGGDGDVQTDNYLNSKASGTVTATLTWIPAAGKTLQSDPPSEPVHIKEIPGASE